jgi:hypothetical protein
MTLPIIDERNGEPVSPLIRPMLEVVYERLLSNAPNGEVSAALRSVLSFLSSPEGRTNANCWAVDLFFLVGQDWTCDWDHLDEELQDMIADMAGALHDSVDAPNIAENFESTPEQLVRRLDAYDAKSTSV